jgi:hypothetical protein
MSKGDGGTPSRVVVRAQTQIAMVFEVNDEVKAK